MALLCGDDQELGRPYASLGSIIETYVDGKRSWLAYVIAGTPSSIGTK